MAARKTTYTLDEITAAADTELARLRRLNDNPNLNLAQTQMIRGQIVAWEKIRAWGRAIPVASKQVEYDRFMSAGDIA